MYVRSLQGSRCQVPVKVIPLGLFSSQTQLSLWTSVKKKLPLRYWYAALQTGDVLQNAEACTEYLPGDFRQKFSFQSVAHRKYSDVAREW